MEGATEALTLRLLHRASTWLAVDKPPGALVIPGRGEAEAPSLVERLQAQLGAKVWVVHRLDKDTSGVLLFALDAQTHRALSMAFEAGRIEKRYLAIVQGALLGPLDLQWALAPARRGRMRPVKPGEAGKAARTLIRPVQALGTPATLVEAVPLTGRTHQIRVHLQAAGHPLLVDHQYGPRPPFAAAAGEALELARTPLHAASVDLSNVEGWKGPTQVQSPLPEDLLRAVDRLQQ